MVEQLSTQAVNNNTSAELTKSTSVRLSNATPEQNRPDSFDRSTGISYYLPVSSKMHS
jgi:hypothetical protein